MATVNGNNGDTNNKPQHPFRKAVFRGMGVVFPPLFTILIFVWVINTTQSYVLEPVTVAVREALVRTTADIRVGLEPTTPGGDTAQADGLVYHRVGNNTFVPKYVYDKATEQPGDVPLTSAMDVYRRYVELTYLRPYYTVPCFLAVFVLLLYMLGKIMAAGIGRFFWNRFEQGIHRLPLVRNVYSSVKQVTDFLFAEREIEYTRVVAVEYPRIGIWSLGFVTGESMLDIAAAANESVISVLMCTSPMPMTGFTVTVRRSEVIDLNITVDQAFQYIISCGVVVPPHQFQRLESSPAPVLTVANDSSAGHSDDADEPMTGGA